LLLELTTVLFACGGVWLAGGNAWRFLHYARRASTAGRRAAAGVLALLQGALVFEGVLFMLGALVATAPPRPSLERVADLLGRGALFGGTAGVSLIVWRAGRRSV
jgi:hypothetical protein